VRNQFDIRNYYDVNTNSFISPEAKTDAIDELRYMEEEILNKLSNTLEAFLKCNMESDCQNISIILEPKKEKILYCYSIYQVIDEFNKYNNNHYDEYAKKCLDELNKIRKEKKKEPSGRFVDIYSTFKGKHIEDVNAQDVIDVTDLWINPRYADGEFYEKSSKKDGIKAPAIVLYLKTICKNANYNDYLIEVFAHELFHAYHWLSFDRKCHSSWNYSNCQTSTVKEGLASYFEYKYTSYYLNKGLADVLKADLAKHSMKHYPYSSFNLINDDDTFRELFYISLRDFGVAYNKLLKLFFRKDDEIDRYIDIYYQEKKALKECVREKPFPLEQRKKLEKLIEEKGNICYPNDIYKTNGKDNTLSDRPLETIDLITKEYKSHVDNVINVESFKDLVEKYVTRNYEEQKRGAAQFDTGIYIPLNIPKKTFYNNLDKPQKDFAIACALMLKLNLNEAIKLIERAGYKLLDKKTSGNERDYIIYWAIDDGDADLVDINKLLIEYGQKPLYPLNVLSQITPVELEE